eukprot:360504-Chlamydomonas_euryale.AAC.1
MPMCPRPRSDAEGRHADECRCNGAVHARMLLQRPRPWPLCPHLRAPSAPTRASHTSCIYHPACMVNVSNSV